MLHEGQVPEDPCHAGGAPGGPRVCQLPLPLPDGPAQHKVKLFGRHDLSLQTVLLCSVVASA